MRELGFIKTEEGMYKVTKIEEGRRRAHSKPRCPVIVYEKGDSGWDKLEKLDGETPRADKKSAFTDLEDDMTSWRNALDAISFYDSSEVVEQRRKF